MTRILSAARTARLALPVAILVGSALLVSSSDTPSFTVHDKAYYADPHLVAFVRPGLVLKILSAEIATDGTIRARFKLTDPKGLPLDRAGVTTPGAVSVSFVAAAINQGQTQYKAYTRRTVTSPITSASAEQASTDSGGRFEVLGDGEYLYTFGAKAPADHDRSVTHTIGAFASRDITEFDLGRQYDNAVYHFVPDGSAEAAPRDVVRTETCNKCHDPIALHGSARRKVELCILCHQSQTTDPDTGNTVNFPVMIHKIHMGARLPSVRAGLPYRIIGYGQSVHDFSTVAFPADPRNCQVCHDAASGAAHADAWLKPNRAACGACHDDVNFATGEGHVNLPQISDNQCGHCHIPEGELEFDASIKGAHTIDRFSRDLPGTNFEILAVDNGLAGARPTVTFSVRDKSGNPVLPSEMARLALVLAGPAREYGGFVAEDARKAQGTADGVYFWTFQQPVPADAKGSYSVGIEGYRNVKLLEGTRRERTVRDAGVNKLFYFSVDGSEVEPRRQIVATEKCNSCHFSLSRHGNNRNRVEHCVQCHTPNQTDAARRPAADLPAESVNFRMMIHRIHTKVRYPGDTRNCKKCHVNGSEQLPLLDGLPDVVNPRGLLNPIGPTAAACTACHTSVTAASHALSMTTPLGESCAACHAPTARFSVDRSHAR